MGSRCCCAVTAGTQLAVWVRQAPDRWTTCKLGTHSISPGQPLLSRCRLEVQPEARGEGYGPPSPERIRRFRTFAASWLLLSFLSIFAGKHPVYNRWSCSTLVMPACKAAQRVAEAACHHRAAACMWSAPPC